MLVAAVVHEPTTVGRPALVLIGSVGWVIVVAACHGYEGRLAGVGVGEYRAVAGAAVRLLALCALASYPMSSGRSPAGRHALLIYFPLLLSSALLARYCLRKSLHRARLHGHASDRVVVVGRDEAVGTLIAELHREPVHGLLPVAACVPEGVTDVCGVRPAGSIHDAVEVARRCAADVVVVASPSGLDGLELRRLSWELDDLGIDLVVSPGIVEVTGPRISIRPAATLSLLHIERPALHGVNAVTKEVFDRVAAGVLLIVLAPIMLLVAVVTKMHDGGPVLFRQTRVGIGGRDFRMVKFRSMVPGAETLLNAVKLVADDGNGVLFKRHDDPRVTSVGRVLRRYSLDELPQLFNVLRGDMSIVGPRPPLRSEVQTYGVEAARRLRVKPGLTGLWQVSGRSDLSWDESLRLDLRYVDNWSMLLDLQILWRTARAVLRGAGAY